VENTWGNSFTLETYHLKWAEPFILKHACTGDDHAMVNMQILNHKHSPLSYNYIQGRTYRFCLGGVNHNGDQFDRHKKPRGCGGIPPGIFWNLGLGNGISSILRACYLLEGRCWNACLHNTICKLHSHFTFSKLLLWMQSVSR
jgi:hypothetical protein